MFKNEWEEFCRFRADFKSKVEQWNAAAPELAALQRRVADEAGTPQYPLETAVVYNKALDELTPEDEIRLIVIGDNPGKDEQLARNNRYLVGQAGKIADGFFRRNAGLGIDFRKNVIILNKTPLHTAKTAQLKKLVSFGGPKVAGLLQESQLWMAERTARLHSALGGTELWLVGYSELQEKGVFCAYRNHLQDFYRQNAPRSWENVFVFQHFSMNRFTIDLAEFRRTHGEGELEKDLHSLGTLHKNKIFSPL